MGKQDLRVFIGKNVEVRLFRKFKYHVYHGRLTDVRWREICLERFNDRGRLYDLWVSRPRYCRDRIIVLKGEKL